MTSSTTVVVTHLFIMFHVIYTLEPLTVSQNNGIITSHDKRRGIEQRTSKLGELPRRALWYSYLDLMVVSPHFNRSIIATRVQLMKHRRQKVPKGQTCRLDKHYIRSNMLALKLQRLHSRMTENLIYSCQFKNIRQFS